ncbi:MBL fold metallo-hydrolase [Acetobacterium sp.]|uniref:MBL fold metallo-hydrolase n=1 Tax=Acetobacterium sp. TaxID=1872094 RepID=UPI003593DCD7
MALKHISGNTFYSEGDTDIGVCGDVLIDTDINPLHLKTLLTDLAGQGMTIDTILNTHAHPDHFGGNAYVAQKTRAKIRATKKQALFMEELRLLELVTYCAKAPSFESDYSVRDIPACHVDEIISDKGVVIHGRQFDFTPLPGHALHQIGIVTPDGVLFAGDVLMADEQIDKYKIPVIVDVAQAFADLHFIEQGDYQACLFAHIPLLNDYQALIDRNHALLEELGERILAICQVPMGREAITGALSRDMELYASFIQFGHVNITVGAYLTWLGDQNLLEYIMADGIMKAVRK